MSDVHHFFAPDELKCDFCLERDPVWDYHTNMFVCPEDGDLPMYVDDGEWGVCDTCHALIQARDLEGLTARALRGLLLEIGRGTTPRGAAVDLAWNARNQARLYEAFFANVLGFDRVG